jgi:hypothetical protein
MAARCAPFEQLEEIHAENAGEKSQRKQGESSAEAATAVGGAGRRWSARARCHGARWVSKMWEYIGSHNLQNPENRRKILADDKLQRVFGKDKVTAPSPTTATCSS